jgi:hypothetical protein
LVPGYTPSTVPFRADTIFKSIDPGLIDIWTGVSPSLLFEEEGEDGMINIERKM